ncbi:BMP family ABC transporter substrate-binding protein [Desulfovibrionales bacterium]
MRRWYGIIAVMCLLVALADLAWTQDKPFIMGMLLVGPYNDKGWNQAHYEAGKYVERKLPGVQMVYIDKANPVDRPGLTIPWLVDEMATQGAKIILATADDMKDGIREAAKKHPEIIFIHALGDDVLTGKAPKNLGNVLGRMEYGKMLAGFTAAMTTKSGKIGYLGSLHNDATQRMVDSCYQGALYAWTKVRQKPADGLKFSVNWIGFWFNIPGVTSDPNQVTAKFFDNGIDVVISGIDTSEASQEANQQRKAGAEAWAIPYDYKNACEKLDQVCLGVPYFNWGPAYLTLVGAAKTGTWKQTWDCNSPDWKNINNPETTAVGFIPGPALAGPAKTELNKFIQVIGSGQKNPLIDLL